MDEDAPPYPKLQLLILGMIKFIEAVAWTSIFPYAYFMVSTFGPGAESNAALYAGLLVSIFTFSEFASGFMWAKISDRIGRKPTLLIGVLSGATLAVCFGVSESLPSAVTVRAFAGLLNPNVGVVQTCIGELVPTKSYQARAFPFVSLLRGLGTILGPVIGGMLSQPLRSMPSIFSRHSYWATYPYLLPNLVVAIMFVCCFIITVFYLEETNGHIKPLSCKGMFPEISWNLRLFEKILGSSTRYKTVHQRHETAYSYAPMPSSSVEEGCAELQSLNTTRLNERQDSGPRPASRLKTWNLQAILQILSVTVLSFHKVAWIVLVPVFLATPASDDWRRVQGTLEKKRLIYFTQGFGLNEMTIGYITMTQGLIAVVMQAFVIPRLISIFGALRINRIALCSFSVLYFIAPLAVLLPWPLSIGAMLLILWAVVLVVGIGTVCSAILITNTVSDRTKLASVNGAAGSFSCLSRSVGVLVAAQIFTIGRDAGIIGLSFWSLTVVAVLGAIIAFTLKDSH